MLAPHFQIVKILFGFELKKDLLCIKVMAVTRIVIEIEILRISKFDLLFGVGT